ncbi:MAG: hypothetical protein JST82_01380 [Bacteroidetes bacterium]|nr:hypothetical protein [Bacteroidota bacterium]
MLTNTYAQPHLEIGVSAGMQFASEKNNLPANYKMGPLFAFQTDIDFDRKQRSVFGTIGIRTGTVPGGFFGLTCGGKTSLHISKKLRLRIGLCAGPWVYTIEGAGGRSTIFKVNVIPELSTGILINNIIHIGIRGYQPLLNVEYQGDHQRYLGKYVSTGVALDFSIRLDKNALTKRKSQ